MYSYYICCFPNIVHSVIPPAVTTCPGSYAFVYGGCYLITTLAATWIDTAIACQQQGGNLATITSEAQNRWVYEYFRTEGKTSNSIWIGLNDISKEGNYQWIDGSGNASSFSYWQSGQPDNYGGGQNCIILWAGYLGKWGDIECASLFQGLCKWDENHTNATEGQLLFTY